jgi:alpha-beta hydrolase superfamily lysophospholipase
MRGTLPTVALAVLAVVPVSACRGEAGADAADALITEEQQRNLAELETRIFTLVPEPATPEDDLPAERLTIDLGDRTLYANWVSRDPAAPAFFLLHGNGEHIGEWRPLQAYLLEKGYSSFVFDYTGFGSSTGAPTVARLNQDAIEAYRRFAERAAEAPERIAFAHSLGSSILMEVANRLEPLPTAIMVHGAFTTMRDVLVDKDVIEPDQREQYPDLWNGVEQVRDLAMPVFILHSPDDEVIDFSMGEELAGAVGERGTFVALETPGHNNVYQTPDDATWAPILELVR